MNNIGLTTGYINPSGSDFIVNQNRISMPYATKYEIEVADKEAKRTTGSTGCQTCKNRKYIDGSNESDVSFKSAAHISPEASAMVVSGHEREHVANAVQKTRASGAKLVSASVRLYTAICPECGRQYVAGGVTNTTIKYSDDAYSKQQKALDKILLSGGYVDQEA